MTDRDDTLAWEPLTSEIPYTCAEFDVHHEAVRLPDGAETAVHYTTKADGVVILPFTEDGDVIVVEEWRQPVSRLSRGLPVGTIEPDDDDIVATAHRELTEETGYEATTINYLTTIEPANELVDAVLHYVVAHDCTPTGEQELDHNEYIRAETMAFDALCEEIAADGVFDGRTVTGVLYYAMMGDS